MRKIFTGATVRTMDPNLPLADLVVVEDGVISAVGRENEIRIGSEPDDERHDLQGMTVLPGFIDAHLHFTQFVWDLSLVDLSRAASIEGLRNAIAARLGSRGAGGWILGRRLPADVLENIRISSEKILRGPAAEEPIILGSEDMHSAYLNGKGTEMLESEGVLDLSRVDYEAVTGGDGVILREEPSFAAWRWLADREKTLGEEAFKAGIDRLHARGVTGIYTFERLADIRSISASSTCEKGLRITTGFYEEDLDSVVEAGSRGRTGGMIGVGGLKLFIDGALGSRTAYLLDPYEGESGRGRRAASAGDLEPPARRALSNGLGLCLHAIGDAAVRIALDLLDTVSAGTEHEAERKRIEHIQLLHPDDAKRFGELGAVASVQPIHLLTDRETAWKAWGERCRWAYPLRRLYEGGARVVFGSDAPAGPVDPLLAIRIAATRKLGDGEFDGETWYSGEAIPVRTAFEAHSVEGARAMGMEDSIGMIREGYRADMVAVSRDPFRSEDDLRKAEIAATYVGGERVYEG